MKAFPYSIDNGVSVKGEKGMDLRDYFAAKAMQALIQASTTLDEHDEESFRAASASGLGAPLEHISSNGKKINYAELYSEDAYFIADTMMKSREQK
jgi:hypothetical protein